MHLCGSGPSALTLRCVTPKRSAARLGRHGGTTPRHAATGASRVFPVRRFTERRGRELRTAPSQPTTQGHLETKHFRVSRRFYSGPARSPAPPRALTVLLGQQQRPEVDGVEGGPHHGHEAAEDAERTRQPGHGG